MTGVNFLDTLKVMFKQPKILIVDIETWPIEAMVWQLYDQNVALNQIRHDWSIMAWSAKWHGKKKVYYFDVSKQKNYRDDSKILKPLWDLFDQADIVVGQNSKKFDTKKINARFIINKIQNCHPPSSYRQEDTKVMAKKMFGFTSNRLEYMSKALGLSVQKMVKREFAGQELWNECWDRNKRAWAEMKRYNIADLLATEELYNKLRSWSRTINNNIYHKMHSNVCQCGSTDFIKNGYSYTNAGRFDRIRCNSCGTEYRQAQNDASVKKRRNMLR